MWTFKRYKVNGLLVCDPQSIIYSEQVSNLILLQTFDIKYMDSKVVFYLKKKRNFFIQDMRCDPNNLDNFMTEEDVNGKLKLQLEIEEKRKM